MIQHYLTVALRNLLKNKGQTLTLHIVDKGAFYFLIFRKISFQDYYRLLL